MKYLCCKENEKLIQNLQLKYSSHIISGVLCLYAISWSLINSVKFDKYLKVMFSEAQLITTKKKRTKLIIIVIVMNKNYFIYFVFYLSISF